MKLDPRIKDLSGKKFNRLTVIGLSGFTIQPCGTKRYKWICLCSCGNKAVIAGNAIVSGNIKSCGCLAREGPRAAIEANKTHEMSKTPEFRVWHSMRGRCLTHSHTSYKNYGGRGIKVCERWDSFENFIEDMGRRPTPVHTIERRENNNGYSPSNCFWATRKQQHNNKRNNHRITFRGETLNLIQWSEKTGINANTLSYRIKHWDLETALTP